MAPEVVKQTAYTSKADIWSLGCLVVEMLTGAHPWANLTQMQAIFRVSLAAFSLLLCVSIDFCPLSDRFVEPPDRPGRHLDRSQRFPGPDFRDRARGPPRRDGPLAACFHPRRRCPHRSTADSDPRDVQSGRTNPVPSRQGMNLRASARQKTNVPHVDSLCQRAYHAIMYAYTSLVAPYIQTSQLRLWPRVRSRIQTNDPLHAVSFDFSGARLTPAESCEVDPCDIDCPHDRRRDDCAR